LDLTDELVKAGTHVLCIKDMAGLLKPKSANMLVDAIRQKHPDLPLHIHTHDTAGAGVASMLACAKAGADVVDVAVDSMSGLTSQPSMGAMVSALDTGLDLDTVSTYSGYWEQTRTLYGPFECTSTMRSGNADVYQHEIPGGQYTNLQFQAYSLGLGDQFEQVKKRYKDANEILGDIVKVTPSSKVVGDLAQFMVQHNLSKQDVLDKASELSFPNSVVEYLQGQIGQPYGGFPEPFRSDVLKEHIPRIEGRPGEEMAPLDFEALEAKLKKVHGSEISECDVMSAALYPKVAEDFFKFRSNYGPVDKLNTRHFLVGPKVTERFDVEIEQGKILNLLTLAQSKVNPETGERQVFFELNGQARSVMVVDNAVAKESTTIRNKAEEGNDAQVGAPMKGEVVQVKVSKGDLVEKGQVVAVMSAMKMEMAVQVNATGKVKAIHVEKGNMVLPHDLMIEIEPTE